MIRHMIMFKFKDIRDENERLEKVNRIKDAFGPLRNIINVVESYEIAVNFKKTEFSYDMIIISEYNTWEDLEFYLKHPEHQKAINLCGDIKKEKAVLDYEF